MELKYFVNLLFFILIANPLAADPIHEAEKVSVSQFDEKNHRFYVKIQKISRI